MLGTVYSSLKITVPGHRELVIESHGEHLSGAYDEIYKICKGVKE